MSEGVTSTEIWFAVILITGIVVSIVIAYKGGYNAGRDIGRWDGYKKGRDEAIKQMRNIE